MVIPIGHEEQLKPIARPYITWGLIAVNILIYAMESGLSEAARDLLIHHFGVTPVLLFGHSLRPVYGASVLTLVTSQFLHVDWTHVLGNMLYLWVFGDDIEDALGRFRFLAFYLLSGVAAALSFSVLNAHSVLPLVGASGAVSGVLAANLMLRPCSKVSLVVLRVTVQVRAYWAIGAFMLMQLFFISIQSQDSVAYVAHVGGLLGGGLLFLAMRPPDVALFQCREKWLAEHVPVAAAPAVILQQDVHDIDAERARASAVAYRNKQIGWLAATELGLTGDFARQSAEGISGNLQIHAVATAAGAVRDLSSVSGSQHWRFFLATGGPCWIAFLFFYIYAFQGKLRIAAVIMALGFILMLGVPFAGIAAQRQGQFLERMKKLPPPGTPIAVDQAGLRVGEDVVSWADLCIHAVQLQTILRGNIVASQYVEYVRLSTPTGTIHLDAAGLVNGQEIIDAVCTYARIKPMEPARSEQQQP